MRRKIQCKEVNEGGGVPDLLAWDIWNQSWIMFTNCMKRELEGPQVKCEKKLFSSFSVNL